MKEIPDKEAEAIMRLYFCATRSCSICKYNKRKRVTVKVPQRCRDIMLDRMNVLADATSVEVLGGQT